ncbi:hypothetical protein WICPIJ_004311 [Wickerhamomyces pijperi]|uniref:Uncharacterized protein n=1 Tax=Wickerhamomyces pijperi TaxID=599730 RepID=A0A9P8TN17_WICPI|nr:hypothetical protein WICPIJ_004311 [Wickerhamomyces pijperi]
MLFADSSSAVSSADADAAGVAVRSISSSSSWINLNDPVSSSFVLNKIEIGIVVIVFAVRTELIGIGLTEFTLSDILNIAIGRGFACVVVHLKIRLFLVIIVQRATEFIV